VQGDPYKTLFVSRLSYEVTERKLRHEFEEFGPIKRIRLVHDMTKGEWTQQPATHWGGRAGPCTRMDPRIRSSQILGCVFVSAILRGGVRALRVERRCAPRIDPVKCSKQVSWLALTDVCRAACRQAAWLCLHRV
jgi:hypothetical protein